MKLFARAIAALVFALCHVGAASAQCVSPSQPITQSELNSEIAACLPDNVQGLVSPFIMRQVLTDMTAAQTLGASALNVKAFGAVCDGTTDDTVAIQAAISASELINGVPVYLPGFCAITSSLNVTAYTAIVGNGPNSGIRPPVTVTAFAINTQASVYMANFAIIYPSAANSGTAAISVTAGSGQENVGSLFNALTITFSNYGINFIKASKFTVSNCIIDGVNQNAIAIQNANAGDSGDSTVYANNIGTVGGAAIYWASSGGIRISNNKINVAPVGIQIALASGVTTTGIYIIGNSIEGISPSVGLTGSGAAIQLGRQGTTGNLLTVIIAGNELVGNYGVYAPTDMTGAWLTGLTINGGTFAGNPGVTTYAVNVDSITGIQVSGVNIQPSIGGATTGVVTGSAATQGSVGPNSCSSSCSADSIASSTIARLGPGQINIPGPVIGTNLVANAATPTSAAGQVAFGNTTSGAGSGNCPTGTVGGKSVGGCLVISIGGVTYYVPVF